MNRTMTVLSTAALLIGMTACSTGTPTGSDTSTATPAATFEAPPVEVETPEPTPEPTTEEPTPEPESTLAEFGEVFEYEDGVAVTIKAVGATIAGEYAAGAEPGAAVRLFEVTVTNNSAEIMDAAEIHGIVNFGTTTAERVFDDGLEYTFQGKILPGKSMTEVQGYAIPADTEQEVLFSITPSWMHEDAMFYGTLPAV